MCLLQESDLHTAVKYQAKLTAAYQKIAELEETIEGKQIAIDKLIADVESPMVGASIWYFILLMIMSIYNFWKMQFVRPGRNDYLGVAKRPWFKPIHPKLRTRSQVKVKYLENE